MKSSNEPAPAVDNDVIQGVVTEGEAGREAIAVREQGRFAGAVIFTFPIARSCRGESVICWSQAAPLAVLGCPMPRFET